MKGFWGVYSLASSISSDLFPGIQKLKSDFPKNDLFSSDLVFIQSLEDSKSLMHFQNDQCICSGWVRLDNFYELIDVLGLPNDTEDDTVVIHAYLKWGLNFLTHIIGDFSFFIYEIPNHKLFLAKDQLGIRPLFYTVHDDCLVFATQIDLIKRILPHKPELNLNYLAKEFKNYPQEVHDTFFDPIKRLKPAHYILLNQKPEVSETRYWELEPISVPKLENKEAYYELVRSYFIQAVKSRVREKKVIGCQLSGGMDSSAIAVLLSRIVPKENLHTYSFVLDEETSKFCDSGKDEKETQEEIIQFAGLVKENHHPITRFHYQNVFEELEVRNRIMGGLANSDSIWQDSLFKSASEGQQVEVMFSGFPGDEGVSCPGGNYYHEYIFKKDFFGLFHHILKFRLSGLKGTYDYFRFKKLGTTKPDYGQIQKKRSVLNPELEKKFSVNDTSFSFQPGFRVWFKSQITRPHTCLRTESEGSYANQYGIETVYPLADLRLIQLVYSLPLELFAPKPYSRALFRNVCMGILPEKVRVQPKFNGAKTLAFADFWIKTKHEELKGYQVKNTLKLLIAPEEYEKIAPESELMGIKKLNSIKEADWFLEKNL